MNNFDLIDLFTLSQALSSILVGSSGDFKMAYFMYTCIIHVYTHYNFIKFMIRAHVKKYYILKMNIKYDIYFFFLLIKKMYIIQVCRFSVFLILACKRIMSVSANAIFCS